MSVACLENAQGAEVGHARRFAGNHCTDPLSVIVSQVIRETGNKVEITERDASRIVFLIEKVGR
jgi:hypothetical protein